MILREKKKTSPTFINEIGSSQMSQETTEYNTRGC